MNVRFIFSSVPWLTGEILARWLHFVSEKRWKTQRGVAGFDQVAVEID